MRWLAMLCSNSSAKLSVMFSLTESPPQIRCVRGLPQKTAIDPMKAAT
jgi:hypothetical protein